MCPCLPFSLPFSRGLLISLLCLRASVTSLSLRRISKVLTVSGSLLLHLRASPPQRMCLLPSGMTQPRGLEKLGALETAPSQWEMGGNRWVPRSYLYHCFLVSPLDWAPGLYRDTLSETHTHTVGFLPLLSQCPCLLSLLLEVTSELPVPESLLWGPTRMLSQTEICFLVWLPYLPTRL